MRFFNRTLQDGIIIDNSVTVRVVSIAGDNVKLAILATKDLLIYREEIARTDTKKPR